VGFLSVLSFAHRLVGERVQPGDIVIDATVGNGNDTVFLAQLVGGKGTVHGFDIQDSALEQTRRRCQEQLGDCSHVRLHLADHATMKQVLPPEEIGRIRAVMFNLGYLPRSDMRITTRPETTLPALEAALDVLRAGGILTVVLYSGHPGGREETGAVHRWAEQLDESRYQVLCYRFLNRRNDPPYLIAVEKKNTGSN
jgi:predicted methyltransferase